MANVQTEHGHVRLANRLLEAVLAADFSVTQLRILFALIRLTYGWQRTEVTISSAELAARCRVEATSHFYRAWRELVDEGVVEIVASGGGDKPHTVRLRKDFEHWGNFTIGEALLARRWDHGEQRSARRTGRKDAPRTRDNLSLGKGEGSDAQDDSTTRTLSPSKGDGVSLTEGDGLSLSKAEGTGSNSQGVSRLGPPKDRKDRKDTKGAQRTRTGSASPRHPEKAAPWMGTVRELWLARYDAPPPALTVKALRPLFAAHEAAEVFRRLTVYLDATEGRFVDPHRFAATWGDWTGEGKIAGSITPSAGRPTTLAVRVAQLVEAHRLTQNDGTAWRERCAAALATLPDPADRAKVEDAIRRAKVWTLQPNEWLARNIAHAIGEAA